MDIPDSTHQFLQTQRYFPIIEESFLLNAIEYSEPSIDPATIDYDVQETRRRVNQHQPLFPALYTKCTRRPGVKALNLCNRYFSILTECSTIASWLPPEVIVELIGKHGIRAFAESETLAQFEEVVAQIDAILNFFPRSRSLTNQILSQITQYPQVTLVREICQGTEVDPFGWTAFEPELVYL